MNACIRLKEAVRTGATLGLVVALASAGGCARPLEPLGASEKFDWVAQPIAFSPPSSRWQRQGDNGGGMLGVRFILSGGGGQCISVGAYRMFAERDPREKIERLIARREAFTDRELLHELSLARARTDNPVSEREAIMAATINDALDRAVRDHFAGQPGFVAADLEAALRAATSYELTLPEMLPSVRLVPSRMQEPARWRIGYECDTTLAGRPAFASYDTLITPERPLLYREIFWVVRGYGFKAVYQGTPENLDTFDRVVESIQFPEGAVAGSK
jgi:hypothetical protein